MIFIKWLLIFKDRSVEEEMLDMQLLLGSCLKYKLFY